MDSGLLAALGPGMTKTPARARAVDPIGGDGLLLPEPAELLLEAREAAAAVEQMLLPAGPGRVRLRVDVEAQRVARLAPGGAGGELGPVGHDDLDGVIIRVNVGFHRRCS